MDNFITTDTGDTIGFYKDLSNFDKKQMHLAVDKNDWESVETFIEIQRMLDKYIEYDGLLVISDHNGMGYTVEPYKK